MYMTRHRAELCENMTSSTEPEVHNMSQRRQEGDQATVSGNMHKNSVKFSHVVPDNPHVHTDKHAYHIALYPPPPVVKMPRSDCYVPGLLQLPVHMESNRQPSLLPESVSLYLLLSYRPAN